MKRFFAALGICLGSALVALALSAANTALPSIRASLGATLIEIQWVVNITAITRGSLVATIGRLADMFGRRRIFLLGIALLIVASLVGGVSPNTVWLMVSMGLAGISAAALLAVSQALLAHLFPPQQMGRAMALWSVALGLGIATGSIIAGGILEIASWRWVYFATIPFAAVAWGLTFFAVDESRDETRSRKVDWIGLALLIIGVAAIVTATIQGQAWGWAAWPTVGLFAIGAVAVAAFLWVEARIAHPLLQLKLFANRMFIAGSVANLCFICFMLTSLFLTPLFLTFVVGAEPIEIGLVFVGLGAPIVALGPVAGLMTERWGPKPQVLIGMLLLIGCSVWMTTLSVDSSVWDVALPLIFYGVAWALVQGAAATAAISSIPKELAGAAAGGFVMMGGIGGAIGLAVGGTIVRSVYSVELGTLPTPGAFADAWDAGMWFLFGVGIMAFVVVLTVMKGRRALGLLLLPLLFAPLDAADVGFATSAHERHRASGRAVTFGSKYGIDVVGNPIGGLRRGLANASSLGADMTMDVRCLELHSSVVWRSGQSLSANFIGNQFPVQQLFGGSSARLNELYLRYDFLCDRAEVKGGRLNAGNDFLTSPLYYNYVLNGIDGNPVAVTLQTPFFVYQDAQWGAVARLKSRNCRWIYKFGAYLGNLSVADNRYHGFNFTFAAPQGYMLVTECKYVADRGHYAAGAYYVTKPTVPFARQKKGGNWGYYFLLDQTIYQCGKRTVTPWIALLFAPASRNDFPFFYTAGVVGKGLFRECDSTNFGMVYGSYSPDKPGSQDFEMNLELNHFFRIRNGIDFGPVMQYIIHPSGQSRIPNAWVVGFQLSARLW